MHDRTPATPAPPSADDGAPSADAPSAGPPASSPLGTAPVSLTVLVAAAASLGAGLVHGAAAGTHAGADTVVRLFAVTAALQVGWAALALARPARPVLTIGVVLNGGAAIAWALSRTRGLPWPAELEATEDVGTQDLIAAGLGALAALGAMAALLRPRLAVRRAGAPLGGGAVLAGAAVLALAVPGMAAQHAHGPSHEHGHDGMEAAPAGGDHAHSEADQRAAGEHADNDHAGDHAGAAAGPIISLDDERLSDEQRAAAQQLIDDTRAGMARFTDVESVQAAGYMSIGDGVTGYEHFINVGFIADGIELDPNQIESIVFTVAPDGSRTLASAMYILQFGKTLEDVPDVAGELTSWHDHQNLCWEGARVVGTTDATGSCQRGTFRATPPMLHVWMTEHPCGPFAGIEGSHGSGCGDHDH